MNDRITISRRHGPEGPYMSVSIQDGTSMTTFATVNLTLEDFALAITGQGHVPCDVETRHLERVGMVRQTKHECVPFPSFGDKDAALAPFEVDGWQASRADLGNHHKYVKGGYMVTFVRWVDTAESSDD